MTDREQALLEEREELRRECDRLREALAFARSVIKSGEPWTSQCEEIIGAALNEAAPPWRRPGRMANEREVVERMARVLELYMEPEPDGVWQGWDYGRMAEVALSTFKSGDSLGDGLVAVLVKQRH